MTLLLLFMALALAGAHSQCTSVRYLSWIAPGCPGAPDGDVSFPTGCTYAGGGVSTYTEISTTEVGYMRLLSCLESEDCSGECYIVTTPLYACTSTEVGSFMYTGDASDPPECSQPPPCLVSSELFATSDCEGSPTAVMPVTLGCNYAPSTFPSTSITSTDSGVGSFISIDGNQISVTVCTGASAASCDGKCTTAPAARLGCNNIGTTSVRYSQTGVCTPVNSLLWLIVGTVAAVGAVGAAAFCFLRSKRKTVESTNPLTEDRETQYSQMN
jgi:hypothetical protein